MSTTSTIGEFGRQVSASNDVANQAVAEATRTNEVMNGLVRAAQRGGRLPGEHPRGMTPRWPFDGPAPIFRA